MRRVTRRWVDDEHTGRREDMQRREPGAEADGSQGLVQTAGQIRLFLQSDQNPISLTILHIARDQIWSACVLSTLISLVTDKPVVPVPHVMWSCSANSLLIARNEWKQRWLLRCAAITAGMTVEWSLVRTEQRCLVESRAGDVWRCHVALTFLNVRAADIPWFVTHFEILFKQLRCPDWNRYVGIQL